MVLNNILQAASLTTTTSHWLKTMEHQSEAEYEDD